jgi:hypothetical protein
MSAVEEEVPKSWLFSQEEIQNSPSVRMGVTFEEVQLRPVNPCICLKFKLLFYSAGAGCSKSGMQIYR